MKSSYGANPVTVPPFMLPSYWRVAPLRVALRLANHSLLLTKDIGQWALGSLSRLGTRKGTVILSRHQAYARGPHDMAPGDPP